ncbi:MAG: hypothetical protein QGG36_23675 [Pirellulaceae bacterium]|jgi:DNA repair photolyase|nr:hypothetical protein [Pirellulaceae bacterium]MDP7018821.1 hypothetical protein [Pirellulaceae bacterium]
MIAPVVPGLNDSEMPRILAAAAEAGAQSAAYVLLRLPLAVEPVFIEWLTRTQPEKSPRVLNRIRGTRDGSLNQAEFGERMRGSGAVADQIGDIFRVFSRKHGLDRPMPTLNCKSFRAPTDSAGQLRLF